MLRLSNGQRPVALGRWYALGLIGLAVALSLTPWFTAAAIVTDLEVQWSMTASAISWLSNGVQIGFVCGALLSGLLGLPDRIASHRLMAAAAVAASAANGILLLEPGVLAAVASRFLTGVALAGVYPSAIKVVSSWFARDRGLALGALIAALTLGSSLPHLFYLASSAFNWPWVVAFASAASLGGAIIFWFGGSEGPYRATSGSFNLGRIITIIRDRDLLLVNIGYFGHMWELYAMWTWLLVYVREAFLKQSINSLQLASLVTFFAIAAGVIGCILGGLLSDCIGRTLTTAGMMLTSALCAFLIGFTFDGPTWVLIFVVVVWGIAVIGDSGQFSAAISELAELRYVGTALALQLGIGFLLTAIAIWAVPQIELITGSWQWAFLILVPGPLIGATAMLLLRARPASRKLANGLR